MSELIDYSDEEIREEFDRRDLDDQYSVSDLSDEEILDEFYSRDLSEDESNSLSYSLAHKIRNDMGLGKCVKDKFLTLIEMITGKVVFFK